MAVEIAGGKGSSVGFVMRRLNFSAPAFAGAQIVRVYIGQVDEDAHRGDLVSIARALHSPVSAPLSHHYPLVEDHFRVHPARRRVTHFIQKV
jgi:hypothetical protein